MKTQTKWAIILGITGGFGSAIATVLAEAGFNIIGVHFDLAEKADTANNLQQEIEACGVQAQFFNINAANLKTIQQCLENLMHDDILHPGDVNILVHAIAFGSLLPFIPYNDNAASTEIISQAQMNMTMNTMAHSFLYWTQQLITRKLITKGSKLFALTSIGSSHVLPSYGAVSAAKSALESHIRQLACELAPYEIAVNALRPGITATDAMMQIPNSASLIRRAEANNPHQRITTPYQVAEILLKLASIEDNWMTGNVIGVDGAEKYTL